MILQSFQPGTKGGETEIFTTKMGRGELQLNPNLTDKKSGETSLGPDGTRISDCSETMKK